jgi:hypothetical protein
MSMDRRTTIKWMLAAAATLPSLHASGESVVPFAAEVPANRPGYGTDPDLMREWKAGEPWPLTLAASARDIVAALCDLIIPADEHSPAASAVGVVDFIDEWISAPYPQQRADRLVILDGLAWIHGEAQRRFGMGFSAISDAQRAQIADDICSPAKAKPGFADAAKFFAKFRDLTAGGFYTTPVGMNDIGYRGNVQLTSFEGPPPEALRKAGLA